MAGALRGMVYTCGSLSGSFPSFKGWFVSSATFVTLKSKVLTSKHTGGKNTQTFALNFLLAGYNIVWYRHYYLDYYYRHYYLCHFLDWEVQNQELTPKYMPIAFYHTTLPTWWVLPRYEKWLLFSGYFLKPDLQKIFGSILREYGTKLIVFWCQFADSWEVHHLNIFSWTYPMWFLWLQSHLCCWCTESKVREHQIFLSLAGLKIFSIEAPNLFLNNKF